MCWPRCRWKLLWRNIRSLRCLFDAVKTLWILYLLKSFHQNLLNRLNRLIIHFCFLYEKEFGLIIRLDVKRLSSCFPLYQVGHHISILSHIYYQNHLNLKVDPILTCIKFPILFLNFGFHNNYVVKLKTFCLHRGSDYLLIFYHHDWFHAILYNHSNFLQLDEY